MKWHKRRIEISNNIHDTCIPAYNRREYKEKGYVELLLRVNKVHNIINKTRSP